MTHPTDIVPTQGTNASSYEWILDVAAVPVGAADPDWITFPDITALQPNQSDRTSDGSTYANKGQEDTAVIGETFNLALNAKPVKNALGEIHPALALLLAAANAKIPGGDASKRTILARYYHYDIPDLAYEYTCEVSWTRANTGNADVEFFSFTLTSKGDRKVITNPALEAPVAPTITTALPTEAVEGAWVEVTGTGFANATSVKFGDDEATAFVLASGARLLAQVPAGDAGPAAIVVSTPAGASSPFSYTRGA
ncbi:MAG: IPT/TIG domain-containing protein [Leucobacter sp.]